MAKLTTPYECKVVTELMTLTSSSTQLDFAKNIGVVPATVTKWKQEGIPEFQYRKLQQKLLLIKRQIKKLETSKPAPVITDAPVPKPKSDKIALIQMISESGMTEEEKLKVIGAMVS